MPAFHFKVGDLRRLVRQVNQKTKVIRPIVYSALKVEINDSEKRIRKSVSATETRKDAVAFRSGSLAESTGSYIHETPYTFSAVAGFLNATGKTAAAAATHTGNVKMPIVPVRADKLAFPVRGVSPSTIIDSRGVQLMTPREASSLYFLRYTDTAILGRPLKSSGLPRGTTLQFLFARRDSVVVPKRIDMLKELRRTARNFTRKVIKAFREQF